MLYRYMVGCLCFLSLPAPASSQELTLKTFIELAYKNDPEIKSILKNKERIEFIVEQSLPGDPFLISAQGQGGLSFDGSGNTTSISTGVSKTFSESGSEIRIQHLNSNRSDRREQVSELVFEQSLYRNFLGEDVRLKKESLSKEKEVINLEVLEAQESYLARITENYLSYKSAVLALQIAENSLVESKKLFSHLKEKLKDNVAKPVEVDKSELQVLERQEAVEKAREGVESIQQQLRGIVGGSGAISISPESKELPKIEIESPELDLGKLRKLSIFRIRKEIARDEIELQKRSSAFDLKVFTGVSADNSERFSSKTNRTDMFVGVKVDIPIGDSKVAADEKAAIYRFSHIEREEKVAVRDLQTQGKVIYVSLQGLIKDKEHGRRKIELIERILRSERKRFESGRVDLEKIIELQTNALNSRLQLQKRTLDYNKEVVRWLALNDELMVHLRNLQ